MSYAARLYCKPFQLLRPSSYVTVSDGWQARDWCDIHRSLEAIERR